MLYKVEWELVCWVGMCNYLVELSPEELHDLELHLEREQKAVKLMGYRITPADIKSSENILDILQEDLRGQEEFGKEADGSKL